MSIHNSGCRYISKGGKISSYGTIHTLYMGIPETDAKDEGAEYWSRQFLPYKKGGFKAEIDQQGNVKIFDKKHTQVALVKSSQIFFVALKTVKFVGPNGYLFLISECESLQLNKEYYLRTRRSLNRALKGKTPIYCDNSEFIRAQQRFKGRELVVLDLGIASSVCKVFTKRGERVRNWISRPLSFKRWGRQQPNPFSERLDFSD